MKKMLMIASVASMIDQFNMENIKILKELGYEVHVACNFNEGNTSSRDRVIKFKSELIQDDIAFYDIPITRSIFHLYKIIRSYIQVKRLARTNEYQLVHCHSPIGGAITRLAFRKARIKGTKVIYTAHGFHFYKGAPIKNWLLFYPIEKLCAKFTDCLITINSEDYETAQHFFYKKNLKICLIPGVGIPLDVIQGIKYDTELKKSLSIPDGKCILLSIGELSKRKNHMVSIKAFARANWKDAIYIICGIGKEKSKLVLLCKKLGIEDRVLFIGYRTDVYKILKMADFFIFPSLQEGLPVALMEAMASGLPVICSDIRGNRDLVVDNKGGYVFPVADVEYLTSIFERVKNNSKDYQYLSDVGSYNRLQIQKYDKNNVNSIMMNIYQEIENRCQNYKEKTNEQKEKNYNIY